MSNFTINYNILNVFVLNVHENDENIYEMPVDSTPYHIEADLGEQCYYDALGRYTSEVLQRRQLEP